MKTILLTLLLCSKLFGAEYQEDKCKRVRGTIETVTFSDWSDSLNALTYTTDDGSKCRIFTISVIGLIINKIPPAIEWSKNMPFKKGDKLVVTFLQPVKGIQLAQVQYGEKQDYAIFLLEKGYARYYLSHLLDAVTRQLYEDAASKADSVKLGDEYFATRQDYSDSSFGTVALFPKKVFIYAQFRYDGLIRLSDDLAFPPEKTYSCRLAGILWDNLYSSESLMKVADRNCLDEFTALKIVNGTTFASGNCSGVDYGYTLVRQGGAKIDEATIILLPKVRQDLYRKAQREAELSRVGVWK